MRKRTIREWLLLLLLCQASVALAEDQDLGNIVAFDADEVEVREGDDYKFVEPKTLGSPPIKIQDQDKRNFLLIKTPGGKTLWVNAGDVKTDAAKDMRHNCSSLAMSQSPDRKQYGMRGVGERCK